MVRTKFSHRKTGGPDSVEGQPASKLVKVSTEPASAASSVQSVDSASILLDVEKVKQATATLPKIPKIKIKKEAAESSEDVLPNAENPVSFMAL